MHPQQGQELPGDKLSIRDSANFLYVVLAAHATCFTPFVRRNFGSEALAWNGLAAFVLLFLTIGFSGSEGMWVYFCLWLSMLLMQRLATMKNKLKGMVVHSRYDGEPWVGNLVPFVKSERAAKLVEALLCLVIGAWLSEYEHTLGTFFLLGAFSLTVKHAIDARIQGVALQRMHDAEMEQRGLMEMYRHQRRF